jgi:hypothetical protein
LVPFGRWLVPFEFEALVSGDFLHYIGPAELHDATIERLERDGAVLRVRIRSEDGRLLITAEFRGVTQVLATAAEGMLLYAVAEMRSDGPQRRFVFANWYDPGEEGVERQLEILADAVDFRTHQAWSPLRLFGSLVAWLRR